MASPEKNDLAFFVINLGRADDRRRFQEDQFARLGLSFVRVEAVDAAATPESELAGHVGPRLGWLVAGNPGSPSPYLPELKRYLTAGEIACYLSHRKALERFLESDAQCAVILEDDAIFAPQAIRAVAPLSELRRRSVIVKLEGLLDAKTNVALRLGRWDESCVQLSLKPTTGAAAYFVTRTAARRMIARMFPIREPYDAWLRKFWSHHITVLELRPFPVAQMPEGSQIGSRRDQAPVRIPSARKGLLGVLRFTIKVEHILSRIVFLTLQALPLLSIAVHFRMRSDAAERKN